MLATAAREVVNADAHPLMSLMHKPAVDPETDVVRPPEKQDKRTIVLLERKHRDTWLYGSNEAALQLIRLPAVELFDHGPRRAPERMSTLQALPSQATLL